MKIRARVPGIWAKGCMLDYCVCVCVCVLSDLKWLPFLGGGRKSIYIIIIFYKLIFPHNGFHKY